MSDEKQIENLKMEGIRSRKVPLTRVSLLVLTLLLTCSVTALIYMSVSRQHSFQQQQKKGAADGKNNLDVDIKVETNDGGTVQDKITYDQVTNIVYYHGDDGSFVVDDFGKGILLFRNPFNRVCYLVPEGSRNSTFIHNYENFLETSNGGVVQAEVSSADNYEILPGEIEDLSIIPAGAHSECTNGYQWMVPREADSGEISQIGRQKRSESCNCHRCCHCCSCGGIRCHDHCHCGGGGGGGSPGSPGIQ